MNAYLNYLLEANIGLCLFLLMYVVFLKNETDFHVKRVFMLTAVIASVTFPLLHFNMADNEMPRLGDLFPTTWLPEIVIYANGAPQPDLDIPASGYTIWMCINIVYLAGLSFCLALLIIRLVNLLKEINTFRQFHRVGSLRITESPKHKSSFSFFNYIFVGQSDQLNDADKNRIIAHESVHARQLHSFDILLIHTVQVIFWFNPVVYLYKKIFVQLHEFEADARAAENEDVNDYCSLMAKVALLSADIKLANHFSNSLTLKRIEMMRTIKTKIKRWKIVGVAAIIPAFFFVVACQDQVMDDVQEISTNSSVATLDLPEKVQATIDDLKKKNPKGNFIALEADDKSSVQADALKQRLASYDVSKINALHVLKDVKDKNGVNRSFIIIDYAEEMIELALKKDDGDQVFMVVEQSATFNGGIEGLGKFIGENLVYPSDAREQGLEGTVFVEFIVNKDGSLSDIAVKKGVSPSVDAQAVAVVQKMPAWTPGKQSGNAVRQRFILPINFKLGGEKKATSTGMLQIREVKQEFRVASETKMVGDKKYAVGRVVDGENNPVPGANLVIKGGTSGTTTDRDGAFQIAIQPGDKLVVSFVGFESKELAF